MIALLKAKIGDSAVDHLLAEVDGEIRRVGDDKGSAAPTLTEVFAADDSVAYVKGLLGDLVKAPIRLAAPIDRQEVWAAGVTYVRSKQARMDESEGAAKFYDLVYSADRPELFFKANAHRVAGPADEIRIRRDATWNVPEPELALVFNSKSRLVGYTVGNDVSSRDIEGANPLYLPQAKVYDRSAALGPRVLLAEPTVDLTKAPVVLTIFRAGQVVFNGSTSTANLNRRFDELAGWLFRDQTFPDGVYLMTGAGVIPHDDFTLQPGDRVEISIEPIGTLVNVVARLGG
jgi:2-dehydro-3-deoxy-D-arabinonate dehydratase